METASGAEYSERSVLSILIFRVVQADGISASPFYRCERLVVSADRLYEFERFNLHSDYIYFLPTSHVIKTPRPLVENVPHRYVVTSYRS
jgi:hypothetical protein